MPDEKPPEKKDEAPPKKEEKQEELDLENDPPKKEEKDEKKEKEEEHEPPAEHPRFKEVYGKMKHFERVLSEKDKDIEALREHTFKLDEELRKAVKGRDDVSIPEPDVVTDPEGHKKWREFTDARRDKDYQDKLNQQKMAMLIEVESGIHDDYEECVKMADREMKINKKTNDEIWSSKNPARAAYKLGRKLMDDIKKSEKDEQDRSDRVKAGEVEGGGNPPPPKKDEPTVSDEERRVIRNLFPGMPYKEAEKKYLEHRKVLKGR